jgi:ABC-type cobalamin/Fe3+-siderophores transport system ATPase subunit
VSVSAVVRPSIRAQGLQVVAGGRRILDVPALDIEVGVRTAIVGPNGAGKSTLLRCLTGVLEPAAGVVTLGGEPILRRDRREVARTIAVVPELAQVPFEMTVEDVVALGRLPHEPPLTGLRQRDIDAIAAAIERVGITDLRGRDVRALSAGERQLAFIALALAQEAPILVLDEPTAHLDIRHQIDVMQLLVDLAGRDGATVLAVLHDLVLAAHFFDRVLVMADGRIVADGPPATALDDARIRSVFGVDPALVRLPT